MNESPTDVICGGKTIMCNSPTPAYLSTDVTSVKSAPWTETRSSAGKIWKRHPPHRVRTYIDIFVYSFTFTYKLKKMNPIVFIWHETLRKCVSGWRFYGKRKLSNWWRCRVEAILWLFYGDKECLVRYSPLKSKGSNGSILFNVHILIAWRKQGLCLHENKQRLKYFTLFPINLFWGCTFPGTELQFTALLFLFLFFC